MHGDPHLPKDNIFAFVANCDTPNETCVVVGERHPRLEIVGCISKCDLEMSDIQFDCSLEATLAEAAACQIDAPMSVTLANERGVFAFPLDYGQLAKFEEPPSIKTDGAWQRNKSGDNYLDTYRYSNGYEMRS